MIHLVIKGSCGAMIRVVACSLAWFLMSGSAACADLGQWRALLHYQGRASDVTSPGFFLHEEGRTDAAAELERTVELLGSAEGQSLACRFPARYTWIRDQGLIEVSHDLAACEKLTPFVNRFQSESLSLLFASEHINDPASAFGHLFLVFRDGGKALSTADTVHFYVEPPDEPFWTYALKGLFGGYAGQYETVPFSAVRSQYLVGSQRALHLYRLDLTPDEVKELVYHLYELEGARFDYFFIRENCAYRIATLLEVAFGENSPDLGGSPYVMPVKVLNSYSDRIIGREALEPTLLRARRLYSRLSAVEKQELRSLRAGGASMETGQFPDGIREIIALEGEYLKRKGRHVPEVYKGIARTRFSSELPPFEPMDPVKAGKGSLLSVGARRIEASDQHLLRFRFAGRDIYDNQFGGLSESVLTLLDLSLAREPGGRGEVHSFELLQARSIMSRRTVSPPLSWSLYAGWNRENRARELAFTGSFGLGKSVAGERLGLALTLEGGARKNQGDGSLFTGPRADLIYYPWQRIKTGVIATKKYGTLGAFTEKELFISAELGGFSVVTRWRREEPEELDSVTVNLNWRF